MQEEIQRLVNYIAQKADAMERGAATKWALGTWGRRVLLLRAKDYRRFQAHLESLLTNDPAQEPTVRYEGSGPYPGPCVACGAPANSYEPLCRDCRAIDDDHYVDPDGNVVKITLPRRERTSLTTTAADLDRQFAFS